MAAQPENDPSYGSLSFLSYGVVLVFGYIFISGLLNSPFPTDPGTLVFTTVWGLGAVALGAYGAIYRDKFIERNKRYFEKMYAKTGFFLFKKQAEGMTQTYMYPFARAMGILFVVIGLVTLYKNFYSVFIK